MKKIIVAGLALIFLFTGSQSVLAASPFNGQSGDCNPGVGIGNYSKNNIPRNNNGCWTSTYISADAGDTVNVTMYYHNNTNNTLTNVRGSIVKSSSGPANTFTFTGTMYSDQGYQNIGTATLSLSSSQTLTYSSTHIMGTASDVRADRDTSIVYNDDGQISIGNIPPGWNDYGEILVAFKVGNNNNNNICYDSSATNYGSYLPCNYNNNYNYNYNYNNTPSLSTNTPTSITSNSATLNGYVNGNGTTINSWIEFPCYGSRYDNKYSQSYSSLSAYASSLSSNTTYTYCVVAQNNNQTYRGNSVTFTTLANNTVVYTNNNIITTVATNVANNSATINGYISNPNYYNTNVSFEYGTSVNLGSVTVARNTNGVSAYNENLTGLSSDTIYFFRAVSQGPNGLIKGTIEIFRTLGATVVRPIIVQGTTVIGNQSPVMLKIENHSPSIGEGDTVDYTITYKNIGKTTLTKPMLQVIVPKGITLTNSTAGTYSSDTNTLTVPLEDLTAGKNGSVNLKGKVVSVPSDSAQIVSTAVLVYTNKSGAQENAMAYVLNTPKTTKDNNSLLGASAFFGGIFPTNLVGWLILTILIMLLVMIARTFYRRQPAHAEATH